MAEFIDATANLISRGGIVMIPLLAMSVIGLALIVERAWFWLVNHRPSRLHAYAALNAALRRGQLDVVQRLVRRGRTIYQRTAAHLLDHGTQDAAAIEAVELERPQFERFMVSLSTIITAAPLLGILGTVLGIIQSFNLLGGQEALTDPRVVSEGIAEALLTTALGLVVALVTLFPYMIFKGQVDRALGRLESLTAAARQGFGDSAAPRGIRTDDTPVEEDRSPVKQPAAVPQASEPTAG